MGIVKEKARESKGDFAIKLEYFVEADNNTGYICTVKRFIDVSDIFNGLQNADRKLDLLALLYTLEFIQS